MSTVIIGAGIIGTSTAYYLSQSEAFKGEIHLVEASPLLFASASGYAAGFLARDWFSPPLAKLGQLSFDLHKQLAEEHGGHENWGYTPSLGTSLEESVGAGNGADWLREGASRSTAAARSGSGECDGPAWLKRRSDVDIMSDGSTTAQIDPLLLCRFLMDKCLSRNVHLHQPAKPISTTRTPSGTLSTITLQNTSTQEEITIPCTRLVLAAGAWTPQVHRTLFPTSKLSLPITSLAGHSLVLKSPHWPPLKLDKPDDTGADPSVHQTCHAVFTTDAQAAYAPELFSRLPHGHIYVAGLNSSTYPLPRTAHERIVDQASIRILKTTAENLLGDDFEVVRVGVCWRPVTKGGLPIVADLGEGVQGEMGGEEGVFVAAGHGAWGISGGVGTGWVVAGMVEGKGMREFVGGLGV
ncbi:hypothetical protein N7G274_008501 [Stereocaulon virgatum]|uniref:FAD dependent oxidoreductase domain-containing protein n=1 Tax=Stereocaulon virgatum TaxID=373712 RepID=A0ABR3ZZD4_9LECA